SRIAILGAGPTGIEAALAAAEAGRPFVVFEAAPGAAGHLRRWGHVRLFTPWDLSVSPRVRRRLATAGVAVPAGDGCPTGHELADVLDRVAALPEIAPHLRFGRRVVAVGREGLLKHEEIASAERGRRPFRLLVADAAGDESIEHAGVVIDATGTYGQPNRLGDGGIPAVGERALDAEIRRDIPDLAAEAGEWAGRTILLAGAGFSAQTAARDLAALAEKEPGTRVIWALRGEAPEPSPADDPLPERARLAAVATALAAGASPAVEVRCGVVVESIGRMGGRLRVVLRHGEDSDAVDVDRILALTGFVGDASLYRQLQVHECYATCGPMKLSAALLGAGGGDCMAQTSHGVDTLTNPEPGLYILGSKSYGRNNTFLLRVGWEQVGEVFGQLSAKASIS
ncbi:MAG TPA: flavoprotein, partial [Acidobacteria bacterium]|nr:flavoprotein [Acidobacteriota bacterium]